ncbi:MAG: FG-GAP repeat domain-containing protein [Planctomycetota bacterium]|jgi:hypothetical protein
MRMAVAISLLLAALLAADDNPYGFSGFEIYKLDWQTRRLTPADVDGDGLMDLLVANNRKAKIEVLLRRKEPVALKTRTGEKLPNDLTDDRFFEKKEILTEKEVFGLVATDLNSDGKVDVAYFGRPEELVVAYGDGKGGFPRSATFPVDGAALLRRGLAAGDLNGDGRTDLALVGKGYTSIYHQTEKHAFAEPKKLPHSDKGVVAAQVVDVNGDGRVDLAHLIPTSPRSVRVRFQQTDGNLGPVVALGSTPWRIGSFTEIDGQPGADLVVVQRSSGVLRVLGVQKSKNGDARPLALGNPLIHAFEQTSGKKARSLAVGDVDGDERNDIVVTEPDTAQVALYLQRDDGRLRGRRTFPSLAGSETVRVADLDGDKKGEIIVLSTGEGSVGVCALGAEGRLPFPAVLPITGKPLAIDTGDVNGDGRADLVVIVEKDKKRSALLFTAWSSKSTEPAATIALEGVKSGPSAVMVMDFNHDGKGDLVLLDRFGKARTWLGAGEGNFAEAQEGGASTGMLNRLSASAVSAADIDGDGKNEMLIADKNFARAVRMAATGGAVKVVDQANGRSPRAQIKGAVAADFDGDGKPDVALFDRTGNMVTLLKRDETGVFHVVGNVPVGTIEFRRLIAADVNGDKRPDLVLAGRARFAVLYAGGESLELIERHTYERGEEYTSLGYSDVGDLNGDGGTDLAIIDNGTRSMAVLSYDAAKGIKERISWRVYEKKMHEDKKQRGGAREVVVADFTGDGKDDIAILVHDRLIVYPQ